MLKKFSFKIPLAIDESFELVKISGEEIHAWGASNISEPDYYLEWKQSFWALTGSTLISVSMEEREKDQTDVNVTVHKPMQVLDPLGICYRVFRKLEKAVERNFEKQQREA